MNQPESTVEKQIEAAVMVKKLFPFKQEEELKIYAILSARLDIAALINDNSAKLVLTAAYSMDEALKTNQEYLYQTLPSTYTNWRSGVLISAMGFQYLVPLNKIAEMVAKIKDEHAPENQKKEMEADKLEAYARYVFEVAGATTYEKGFLTGILKRFRSKIINPTEKKS